VSGLDQPTEITEYYGRLAWVSRYMIDWGHCSSTVTPIRAFTTVIRWFCDVGDRQAQWQGCRHFIDGALRLMPAQHQRNLMDLLDCSVQIPLTLSRRKLGLFFASLDDGDIIDGGPTPAWFPEGARLIRPGAAYLWGKWNEYFPDRAPLWPYTIFPAKVPFVMP
jgi:hypothetical protein